MNHYIELSDRNPDEKTQLIPQNHIINIVNPADHLTHIPTAHFKQILLFLMPKDLISCLVVNRELRAITHKNLQDAILSFNYNLDPDFRNKLTRAIVSTQASFKETIIRGCVGLYVFTGLDGWADFLCFTSGAVPKPVMVGMAYAFLGGWLSTCVCCSLLQGRVTFSPKFMGTAFKYFPYLFPKDSVRTGRGIMSFWRPLSDSKQYPFTESKSYAMSSSAGL